MPIRNVAQYVANLWDWGFLSPALGRCAVSDLDGIVERGGRFLVLETKMPGVDVPRGQAIMFDAMVRAGMTVIVIWGHTNQPIAMQIWGKTGTMPTNEDELRTVVREWFEGKQTGGLPRPLTHTNTHGGKESPT